PVVVALELRRKSGGRRSAKNDVPHLEHVENGGKLDAVRWREGGLRDKPLRHGILEQGGRIGRGCDLQEGDHSRRIYRVVSTNISETVGFRQRRWQTVVADHASRFRFGNLLQNRNSWEIQFRVALHVSSVGEPQ